MVLKGLKIIMIVHIKMSRQKVHRTYNKSITVMKIAFVDQAKDVITDIYIDIWKCKVKFNITISLYNTLPKGLRPFIYDTYIICILTLTPHHKDKFKKCKLLNLLFTLHKPLSAVCAFSQSKRTISTFTYYII